MNRRRFLKTIAVAGGALATGSMVSLITQAQAPAGAPPPAPADPTQSLGRAVSEYGRRSRFETAVRVPFATKTKQSSWTFTPLQDSHGIITPSALHFARHHAGVPDIDPGQHRLLIHGSSKRSLILSMEDTHRLPSVSRVHMIECSGSGLTVPEPSTAPPPCRWTMPRTSASPRA